MRASLCLGVHSLRWPCLITLFWLRGFSCFGFSRFYSLQIHFIRSDPLMKTAKFHAKEGLICHILRGFIHHREFILLQFSKVVQLFASGSVKRKNWKDFHLSLLVEYEEGVAGLASLHLIFRSSPHAFLHHLL